jgi:hypothetical protein
MCFACTRDLHCLPGGFPPERLKVGRRRWVDSGAIRDRSNFKAHVFATESIEEETFQVAVLASNTREPN